MGDRTSTRLPAGVHKLRGNKYSNAVAVLQQHLQRLEMAAADATDTVASKQQHEQVLIDFLIHLEEHCSLQRLAAPCEGPPGGAAPEQLGSCSYAAQLVRCVTPAQLQVARSRTTADWIAFSHAMFQRLVGLVELLDREDAVQQQAQQHQAQQEQQQMPDLLSAQLHQAVDEYVTTIMIVFAFIAEVGPSATAGAVVLNLVTLQPEVASPQHWRRVVQRMQLSPWQLGALASGFRVFSRLKQQNRAQALQLAALVDSCSSLQVQALAAQSGSSDSDRQGLTASTAGSDGSSRAATPGAAAAAQQPPEVLVGTTDDPAQLWRRHPELMQLAPAALNMFIVSSVTRLQIARMVVASFPFVPRPAPIAEAAAWLWEEQPRGVVSTLPVPPEVQEHAAQRSVLLAAQQAWWWEQQAAGDDAAGLHAMQAAPLGG